MGNIDLRLGDCFEGYYNAAVKRIETAKITKAETLPIDYD